jgi:hypothetical protein
MRASNQVYPRWVELLVAAMFVCAAVLSGVHTVPTVRAGIPADVAPLIAGAAALFSFVAVELSIFVSSYAMMRGVNWSNALTLFFSTSVAVVANLYSVFSTMTTGDTGQKIVAAMLGVGAPSIAFTAGKMYVDIYKTRRAVSFKDEELFQAVKVEWDKTILSAYEKYLSGKETSVIVRAAVRSDGQRTLPPPLSVQSDVRPDGQNVQSDTLRRAGHGYATSPDAREIVKAYLAQNPDALKTPVRQLAESLGVGKSTVADAKREWVAQQAGQNEGVQE